MRSIPRIIRDRDQEAAKTASGSRSPSSTASPIACRSRTHPSTPQPVRPDFPFDPIARNSFQRARQVPVLLVALRNDDPVAPTEEMTGKPVGGEERAWTWRGRDPFPGQFRLPLESGLSIAVRPSSSDARPATGSPHGRRARSSAALPPALFRISRLPDRLGSDRARRERRARAKSRCAAGFGETASS